MTNDLDEGDARAGCRVMAERALTAVRELEKQFGVEQGTVTMAGIRR